MLHPTVQLDQKSFSTPPAGPADTPPGWAICPYVCLRRGLGDGMLLFGVLSGHHTPPLPPPAAVCTRFTLDGRSDMCHALETAAEWLSLTSIFPDRPHRWLLGKQRPQWLELAVLNDLEEGVGRDPRWGLVNSFRMSEVTQKHAVQYW